MKTNKKKGRTNLLSRIVEILLFIFILIVFLFSLSKVIAITTEYKAGRDEYKDLEHFIEIPAELETPAAASSEKEENTTETAESSEQISTETTEEKLQMKYNDQFLDIAVDFKSLESMNSDFEGWLYIPALNINYPVVLGADNDYYLTHTFQKAENSAGALFLDQSTGTPFRDYNTIIHGHDMKNGSMFGKLDTFYRDTKSYTDNPYFYVYTEEGAYKYLIFSYYVANAISDTYQLPANEETYLTYKNYVAKQAIWQDVEGIPHVAPIVTLSTCYGNTYTDKRFVVHGIMVDSR